MLIQATLTPFIWLRKTLVLSHHLGHYSSKYSCLFKRLPVQSLLSCLISWNMMCWDLIKVFIFSMIPKAVIFSERNKASLIWAPLLKLSPTREMILKPFLKVMARALSFYSISRQCWSVFGDKQETSNFWRWYVILYQLDGFGSARIAPRCNYNHIAVHTNSWWKPGGH